MKNTEKKQIENCLQEALSLLDAHTRSLTDDLGSESENLKNLVPNADSETQGRLKQLDGLVGELKLTLSGIREKLVEAESLTSRSRSDEPEEQDITVTHEEKVLSHDPDISAQEAANQRHDEPVTLGSIVRSLLMANEPGQRDRRDAL